MQQEYFRFELSYLRSYWQNIKFSRYCPKFPIFTNFVIFQVILCNFWDQLLGIATSFMEETFDQEYSFFIFASVPPVLIEISYDLVFNFSMLGLFKLLLSCNAKQILHNKLTWEIRYEQQFYVQTALTSSHPRRRSERNTNTVIIRFYFNLMKATFMKFNKKCQFCHFIRQDFELRIIEQRHTYFHPSWTAPYHFWPASVVQTKSKTIIL